MRLNKSTAENFFVTKINFPKEYISENSKNKEMKIRKANKKHSEKQSKWSSLLF
jgi:hypothetical protein